MSAADTVLRVMRWALVPSPGAAPPRGLPLGPETLSPRGEQGGETLSPPPAEVRDALAELATVTVARLRLGRPPLGESRALGLDALVLALAIATREEQGGLSAGLLGGLSRTDNAWEWVVRHALAAPALPYVQPALADELRARSPLTALFERPPGEQDREALAAAERLRAHPAGRLALQLRLARPTADAAVRAWRTRLLERLRLDVSKAADGRAFVLDVYEAAMIHHADEHLRQAREAFGLLQDTGAEGTAPLEDAFVTADWWGPLRALERDDVDQLRARRYLGYRYREGIRVHELGRRMRGIA